MTSNTKQTLGPYEVIAPIGAGGMGEVFRARDTRLNRDVAIKVLPKEFASDPDRLRRFEQETKTLASLNHPNILTIHDVGVYESAPYLVSELLEGKTLREELSRGALPMRKAMDYALQIAQGLAAAHGKGIIHRDLKPENVFVTKDGRVKMLDFGLAKLQENQKSPTGDDAPTLADSTQPGMVLGTPAYMSPEQVRGEPADHRSDIFSFGCVLHEMLSGARPFRRNTPVESLNAILSAESPELSGSNQSFPAALERTVRRCLEKAPERRFQNASDLAFALENVGSNSSQLWASTPIGAQKTGVRWELVWPWATAALLGLVLVFSIAYPLRNKSGTESRTFSAPPENKFQLYLKGSETLFGKSAVQVAISPDGRKLAYVNDDGLWLERLDRVDPAVRLVDGHGLSAPFWSPESTDIGYFDEEKLYRTTIDGARPMLVCQHARFRSPHGEGGAWLTGGRIIFCTGDGPLLETSAAGGEPSTVLPLGPGDKDFEEPCALPGGRGVLLVVGENGSRAIAAWTPDGKRKLLLRLHGGLQLPVFSSSGHVIYWRTDAGYEGIWAFPFSLQRLERTHEPFLVSDSGRVPSASNTGALVFSLSESLFFAPRQLTWLDRSGQILGTLGEPLKGLTMQRISPDGHQVLAVSREGSFVSHIWLFDAANGGALPFSPPATNIAFTTPKWSVDGRKVFYLRMARTGDTSLVARPSDGSGEEQTVFTRAGGISPSDHYLLVSGTLPGTKTNGYIQLSDPSKRFISFPEAFQRLGPRLRLSPDDRLLAYTYSDDDQSDLYVVEFPSFTNRRQVSRGGAVYPEWHPNGQELFFLGEHRQAMMSVRLKQGTLDFEAPKKLFDLPSSIYNNLAAWVYDVAPDGRFLMLQNVEDVSHGPSHGKANVQIVLNWFEEFRDKK